MSTINSALGAYQAASSMGGGKGGIIDQSAGVQKGPSFGDLLQTAAQKTVDAQKVSEKTSADAVLGKADLTDVVAAVNNAEQTLNLFLAVRDKVINAYEQISRTQI